MKLQVIIDQIGEQNVRTQVLDDCATTYAKHGKNGLSRITFQTDQPLTWEGPRDFGVIVWLPRDLLKQVLDSEHKEAK